MTIILSKCFDCKYYNRYDNKKLSCKAYPEGIPENIFNNTIEHNKVLEGQTKEYIFEEKT